MGFKIAPGKVVIDEMVRAGKLVKPRAYDYGYAPGGVTVEYEKLVVDDAGYAKKISDKPVKSTPKTKRFKRIFGPRTTVVTGIVVPTTVSAGGSRGDKTPESASGGIVDGFNDVNRGHLMALELGGPNSPWNISPQWGLWQQQQIWRETEREIAKLAGPYAAAKDQFTAPKHHVVFRVEVKYVGWNMKALPRLQVWSFPRQFVVSAVLHAQDGSFVKNLLDPTILAGVPEAWNKDFGLLSVPDDYVDDVVHVPLEDFDDDDDDRRQYADWRAKVQGAQDDDESDDGSDYLPSDDEDDELADDEFDPIEADETGFYIKAQKEKKKVAKKAVKKKRKSDTTLKKVNDKRKANDDDDESDEEVVPKNRYDTSKKQKIAETDDK